MNVTIFTAMMDLGHARPPEHVPGQRLWEGDYTGNATECALLKLVLQHSRSLLSHCCRGCALLLKRCCHTLLPCWLRSLPPPLPCI